MSKSQKKRDKREKKGKALEFIFRCTTLEVYFGFRGFRFVFAKSENAIQRKDLKQYGFFGRKTLMNLDGILTNGKNSH